MSAILLGLTSAICWGTGDFLGGMQSRRLPPLAVVLWSQLAGGVMLVGALAIMRPQPALGSILWGMAGGVVGCGALVLFYRGLATGIMSIVAPVSACGVVLPVLFSLLSGRVPPPLGLLGALTAIAGIVLVSVQSSATAEHRRLSRSALLLSLGAALGFGLFFVCVAQGSGVHGGSPVWTVLGARIGSVAFLWTLVTISGIPAPWPVHHVPQVAMVGILDSGANLLFAIATTQGNLAIVAVLGSLYPVATIVLGHVILNERFSPLQGAGVALALAGVALLSIG